ncbi:glycosyltransferase family 61 protein [Sediminicoccus sp. KRV36]|uniref:glycosyltransferase family 61 protein n=1 Tax=Sediminicoccus sp. KRV36 TaxID=3133721 RepID=UPI00200C3544|nr:glycosyltransferase family 61 protein [Sediminicoccus rosea]UPY36645.1 glycosyltransferase family 61 protein [Sediminicoccus rosea]
MPAASRIVSINEVAHAPVVTSRFSKAVSEEHQPFFGGRSVLAAADLRAPLQPVIGPSITEPGLAERWRSYDRGYRADARISRFWTTDLEEATVLPPFGIVAVGNRLVRDTIRTGDMLKASFPGLDPEIFRMAMQSAEAEIPAALPSPVRRVPGHSFLLGFGVFENYFNWTLRYASRVAMFQTMPSSCRLAVPAPRKAYVNDTLEFMGVPQDRIEPLDGPVVFEKLTLMSAFAFGRYEISPLITTTLREHPRVTELWRRPKRPLFIPRRNVAMRQVVNQEAVEAALKALGFDIFDNAEKPIREQVRAFRNASIVVAPHGAGLANIVYCDPGTPVIEVIPEGYDQGVTSYRSLADLFGLPYTQLFAREAAPDRKGNRCNASIELDIAELTGLLRGLLG